MQLPIIEKLEISEPVFNIKKDILANINAFKD